MSGIQEPNVIDLVTYDPVSGEYALIMIEERPWVDSSEQLAQLSDKINNYAIFALDEGLLRAYPQSADHPLRIQLDCTEAPTPRVQELVDVAVERLRGYGMRFVVKSLG